MPIFISYKSLKAKASGWKYAAQNMKSRHVKQCGGFCNLRSELIIAVMEAVA